MLTIFLVVQSHGLHYDVIEQSYDKNDSLIKIGPCQMRALARYYHICRHAPELSNKHQTVSLGELSLMTYDDLMLTPAEVLIVRTVIWTVYLSAVRQPRWKNLRNIIRLISPRCQNIFVRAFVSKLGARTERGDKKQETYARQLVESGNSNLQQRKSWIQMHRGILYNRYQLYYCITLTQNEISIQSKIAE